MILLGSLLLLSALGVVLAKKPVHASLSFLATLLFLATMYLQLSASFIASIQVLVYAGAILVIFMFVIILFQDAHGEITKYHPTSSKALLLFALVSFLVSFFFLGTKISGLISGEKALPQGFGEVELLGKALYVDFFFPFEAVILLFLVAVIGALYIARKA